jgi:hypothetical protein
LPTPNLFNAHTVLRQQYRERREGIPTMKTLAQIKDGDCKFPVAEKPIRFCGKKALHGLSWCEKCAGRVFNEPQEVIARAKASAREKETAS